MRLELKCSKCEALKDADQFARRKDRGLSGDRGGRTSWCRECRRVDRTTRVIRRYGVSTETLAEMTEAQGGVCAICREPETRVLYGKPPALCLDHDHKTNKPRGLLCSGCNMAIGLLKDSVPRLQAAIEYLNKHERRDHASRDQ